MSKLAAIKVHNCTFKYTSLPANIGPSASIFGKESHHQACSTEVSNE